MRATVPPFIRLLLIPGVDKVSFILVNEHFAVMSFSLIRQIYRAFISRDSISAWAVFIFLLSDWTCISDIAWPTYYTDFHLLLVSEPLVLLCWIVRGINKDWRHAEAGNTDLNEEGGHSPYTANIGVETMFRIRSPQLIAGFIICGERWVYSCRRALACRRSTRVQYR